MAIEQSLHDSIWESDHIITSWKWWVWKSTVSWALALDFSKTVKNTIAVDMDAAHSLWDSLWLEIDESRNGTFSVDYDKKLKLYFLSQIIPDIYNDKNFEQLNWYLDNLLTEGDSILPLLRLAMHPHFSGMPLPHENAAYVLQLIELFENDTLYNIDEKQSIKQIINWKPEKIIIDSENTKWLIRVINSVLSIENTLKNLQSAFHWSTFEKAKWAITRQALKMQTNIHKLAKSELVKNQEKYSKQAIDFHSKIVKASVIIVTQPWTNDLKQTLREIEDLWKMWMLPKHVLVNKYNQHHDKSPKATKAIYQELLKNIPNSVWLSVIDSDFQVVNPENSKDEQKEIITQNLENIAKTFQ